LVASSSLYAATTIIMPVRSEPRTFCQAGHSVHVPGHSTGTATALGTAETVAARVARRAKDLILAVWREIAVKGFGTEDVLEAGCRRDAQLCGQSSYT
jgi:hypothetical protein